MGKAHSTDLRVWFYTEVADSGSCRSAARRFGVSASTSIRLAQRIEKTGSLDPARQGRLMKEKYGVSTHLASVSRLLRTAEFTVKKRYWRPKQIALTLSERAKCGRVTDNLG